jgi:acyl dehydratase
MNLDHVVNRRFAPTEQTYDWRDSALYAVALGMGQDILDEDELIYVYEGGEQRAAPSMSVVLGWPPFWHSDPATGIDWPRILHGEQRFELHRPLATAASIRAEHRIYSVEDKGRERGAVIAFDTEVIDRQDGERIANLRSLQFLRGDGGCGNHGAKADSLPPLSPTGPPTATIDYRTSPQAALLYRLASRDYMPIHADPALARAGGFERPISHGLNNMGLACRAILKRFAPRRPERLRSMAVRFTGPAYPGETIRVEMFAEDERVRFRAWAVERSVLVLDRGECRVAADDLGRGR